MPVIIDYSENARADLRQIYAFHLGNADENVANKRLKAVFDEIEKLAASSLLNKQLAGLEPKYREWLIAKKQYKVYYIRLDTNAIRVLRVYSTRRKPLSPNEIMDE